MRYALENARDIAVITLGAATTALFLAAPFIVVILILKVLELSNCYPP